MKKIPGPNKQEKISGWTISLSFLRKLKDSLPWVFSEEEIEDVIGKLEEWGYLKIEKVKDE